MARSILRLFAVCALCLPLLGQDYGSGIPMVYIQPTDGGPTRTLDDDFESDVTGWATRSGSASCTNTSGDLALSQGGICHYSGVTEGTQPLTADQWAVFEIGATAADHRGVVLRAKSGSSDPGDTIENYSLRCTSSELWIGSCEADDVCLLIAGDVTCAADTGDQFAFMVAGEGDNTELCAWYWDSLDTEPSAWGSPTTWGLADFCTNESGSPLTLLLAYEASTVEDWDTASSTGPDDLKGFPATDQFDVGAYSGTGGGFDFEWIMAGDLNL